MDTITYIGWLKYFNVQVISHPSLALGWCRNRATNEHVEPDLDTGGTLLRQRGNMVTTCLRESPCERDASHKTSFVLCYADNSVKVGHWPAATLEKRGGDNRGHALHSMASNAKHTCVLLCCENHKSQKIWSWRTSFRHTRVHHRTAAPFPREQFFICNTNRSVWSLHTATAERLWCSLRLCSPLCPCHIFSVRVWFITWFSFKPCGNKASAAASPRVSLDLTWKCFQTRQHTSAASALDCVSI